MAWQNALNTWLDSPFVKILVIPTVAGVMGWLGSRLTEAYKARKAEDLEEQKFNLRLEEHLVAQRISATGEYLRNMERVRDYLQYHGEEEPDSKAVDEMDTFVNGHLHVLDKRLVTLWIKYRAAIFDVQRKCDPFRAKYLGKSVLDKLTCFRARLELRVMMLDELSMVAHEVMRLPHGQLLSFDERSHCEDEGKSLSRQCIKSSGMNIKEIHEDEGDPKDNE